MKKDRTLEEAVLRANLSTAQETQQQEYLFKMADPGQNQNYWSANHTAKSPVNESHVNLMQSWHNLWGMDNELLNKK